MLSYQTVDAHTLELLRHLSVVPEFYPEHSVFRALMSMSYFDDADMQPTPRMFTNVSWDEVKEYILSQVQQYS